MRQVLSGAAANSPSLLQAPASSQQAGYGPGPDATLHGKAAFKRHCHMEGLVITVPRTLWEYNEPEKVKGYLLYYYGKGSLSSFKGSVLPVLAIGA